MIIQQYAQDSIDHDINAYVGLSNYSKNLAATASMDVVIAEEDLDSKMSQEAKEKYFTNGVKISDQETTDQLLSATAPNTVISYVAAPTNSKEGFYCYKMLIDTQTYRLCFFRKHRISPRYGAGFTDYDLRSIAMTRKEKGAK
jgi:galactitol-specific phosphotransferase system IIB component